jgi:hypothetical protein
MHVRHMRPDRQEAAEYYFRYIDLVPEGDICEVLAAQRGESVRFFRSIPDDVAAGSYEPGKWTIKAVLAHLNDCERLFTFRAFWFARGFASALPSFEPDIADRHAGADARSWGSHIDEFDRLRGSTVDFFSNLDEEMWLRRGIASETPFSVRALAYLCAGHLLHHKRILEERYLQLR